MELEATNEVQAASLFMGDVLPFDIDANLQIEIIAALDSMGAASTVVFGLASARNDDEDTIAESAWFRVEGSASTSLVVVETDDGTNNNDDIATGFTLNGTFKRFVIDIATGVSTQSPPALSQGAKANVQFFAGNSNGALRAVGTTQKFDMSNYSGAFQLFAQVTKTAATDVSKLSILEYKVTSKLPVLA